MKITVENKEIINPKSISVHDGIIEKFEYNYIERICNIEILNNCWNIRQTFCIKKEARLRASPPLFSWFL